MEYKNVSLLLRSEYILIKLLKYNSKKEFYLSSKIVLYEYLGVEKLKLKLKFFLCYSNFVIYSLFQFLFFYFHYENKKIKILKDSDQKL